LDEWSNIPQDIAGCPGLWCGGLQELDQPSGGICNIRFH
jgi:hypothetical protein